MLIFTKYWKSFSCPCLTIANYTRIMTFYYFLHTGFTNMSPYCFLRCVRIKHTIILKCLLIFCFAGWITDRNAVIPSTFDHFLLIINRSNSNKNFIISILTSNPLSHSVIKLVSRKMSLLRGYNIILLFIFVKLK